MLQGLTAQAFFSDSASVRLGGLLTDRMEAAFAGVYANGRIRGAGNTSDPGRFNSFAVTSQLRVPVTRWWSAVVHYIHYQFTLNAVASQTLGISPRGQRNAVSVGFTLQVPLVGANPDQARLGR